MARLPRLETREVRLDATHAFLGTAAALAQEYADDEPPPRRIRTFSEAAPDDLGLALGLLSRLSDLGLVVHGPAGCAARRHPALAPLAVTDLDERDTVLGSGEVLADTLRRLDATARPAALAVLGSPVVAINSDDIRATVAELAIELGKPVVWVRTDGFRSAVPVTGADAATDALLQLADPGEAPRDFGLLNLLTTLRSGDLDALVARIEALGWRVNRLPEGASVADLQRAATAAASLVLEPDTLDPLAEGLERRFGVLRLGSAVPVGAAATTALLRRLAALAGLQTPVPPLAEDERGLAGHRLAIALPPAWALAVADLVEDLGGEVALLSVPHVDRTHAAALYAFAERRPALQIHVGEAQGFETAGLLRRIAPDAVLGSPDVVAQALRQGVPAAVASPARLLGAGAAKHLSDLLADALEGSALARHAARAAGSPYSKAWLNRSPDWHIKQEVR
uniref:Oxidoreductase/nitrogenase, component 1 n=1 Tax=Cereibacter sphaeroides (strain ATCC 17025 / ATH 2.4.3) TaxID=349102 RepID=A4WQL5_CERS5